MPELHYDYHPPNIDRLRRFSALAGLEIQDDRARVEAFNELDVFSFLDLLTSVNSLARDKEHLERWEEDILSGTVGAKNMSPDVYPPDSAKDLLKDLFEDIQSTLTSSPESIDKAAVRLYFGIVGAHLYDDGNGRSARTAFHLLKHGGLPDDTKILNRSSTRVSELCSLINEQAVLDLMTEEGLPIENVLASDFVGDDKADKTVANYGLSQHLRYLAMLRLIRAEKPNFGRENPPSRLILDEQSEFIKKGFKKAFEQVRVDWFNNFVEIPTNYIEDCIEAIEGTSVPRIPISSELVLV